MKRMACLAMLTFGAIPAAQATVISGTSTAFGVSASAGLEGVALGLAPTPSVTGASPAPYTVSNSAVSATFGTLLSTGVLSVSATSNVDGSVGSKTTSAAATVDSLTASLLGALGLSATTINTNAAVSGDFGALVAAGGTTLTGVRLDGAPPVDLTPAPNTILLSLDGVTVTLNKQIAGGTGTDSRSLEVRGVDIVYTNALGRLNGEIIVSDSFATETARRDITPAPEPTSMVLLGAGLLGLSAARRRKTF